MEGSSAKLDSLSRKVEALYAEKLETREAWADWLYPNHVIIVAKNAKRLAKQKGANGELSQAAALLHDIADIKMGRMEPSHEKESLNIARDVMRECGYATDEIALVVDDAIRYHSCHGDERPKSVEGLVLATADSLAHLQTNFYVFATWSFGKLGIELDVLIDWVLKKLERDLNSKISFDDIREEARPDYELLKDLFSRRLG